MQYEEKKTIYLLHTKYLILVVMQFSVQKENICKYVKKCEGNNAYVVHHSLSRSLICIITYSAFSLTEYYKKYHFLSWRTTQGLDIS